MHSSSPPPQAPHLALGQHGESLAAQFLIALGYEVRASNVRLGRDEIDLIAFDTVDQVLVFVEVKTRAQQAGPGYRPERTATSRKRYFLRRSARRWVAQHQYQGGYRLDLICIAHNRVTNHFKELSWGR